jgi:hypothetical protein
LEAAAEEEVLLHGQIEVLPPHSLSMPTRTINTRSFPNNRMETIMQGNQYRDTQLMLLNSSTTHNSSNNNSTICNNNSNKDIMDTRTNHLLHKDTHHLNCNNVEVHLHRKFLKIIARKNHPLENPCLQAELPPVGPHLYLP